MNAPHDDPVLAITPLEEASGSFAMLVARQSGVYVSSDTGQNWQPLWTAGFAAAVEVGHDNACTNGVFAGVNGGVIRSSDRGGEWTSVQFPEPPPLITLLKSVEQEDGRTVLVAGSHQDGIFRSDDDGRSWVRSNTGLYIPRITALHALGHGVVFAAAECCLFQSSNAGKSWSEVEGLTFDDDITTLGGDENHLLVGTDSGDVFVYDRRRREWSERISLTPACSVLAFGMSIATDGASVMAITEHAIHDFAFAPGGSEAPTVSGNQTLLPSLATCGRFQTVEGETFAFVGHSNGTISTYPPIHSSDLLTVPKGGDR